MPVVVPMRFEDEPLLWTATDVHRASECLYFIHLIESSRPELATKNPMYRNQDRVNIDDTAPANQRSDRLSGRLTKSARGEHARGG